MNTEATPYIASPCILSPTRQRGTWRAGSNPRWRVGLVSALGLMAMAALSATAFAHDGGFGHSRRLIYVSPTSEGLIVEYRLKQGLEEAIVEMVHVDTDRDGQLSAAERDAFFTARGQSLLGKLTFREAQSGKPVAAELTGFELGHSLVQVYRIRVASTAASLLLEDRNFPHKPGQVAIEVAPGLKAELPEEIDLSHADQVRVTLTRVGAQP